MIKISKNLIFSYNSRPKIIAEISGNHGGNKKRFLNLINQAFKNGVDLVKIQSYEPKDITINKKSKNFLISSGTWKNIYLWDLYKKACTPFSWHREAFQIAKKYNKILFSSPFSIRSVDLLESLNCQIYKIASFEITDLNLIRYIASKKKPIIISTGMASEKEIKSAIKEIKKFHDKIIILHCVSAYPTKLKDTNLSKIKILKKMYPNLMIGLSDHTKDIYSSISCIPLGIVAIEKHFKINKKFKTTDSSFSITPEKMNKLCSVSKDIFYSMNNYNSGNVEKSSKKLRRSIFAKTDIEKNMKITKEQITTLRPLIGVPASNFFKIIGKKTRKKILAGTPIYQKDFFK